MIYIRRSIFNEEDNGIFLVLLYIHLGLNKSRDNTYYMSIDNFLQIYNIRKNSRNVSEVKKSLNYMIDNNHIDLKIVDKEYMSWEIISCTDDIVKNTLLYIYIDEHCQGSQFKMYDEEFCYSVLDKLSDTKKMYRLLEILFLIMSRMWFLDNKTPQSGYFSYVKMMKTMNYSNRGILSSQIKILEELDLLEIKSVDSEHTDFNKNEYSVPKWLKEFQNNIP